ncbi:MAG: PHP domain-containing protein [Ruminococcaceae bacterium]|nr:PHP domain-containing protein [Oscillospiraceae bacterium]
MKFQIDHDYHIHSQLSSCSRDPEQTTARILQYARENQLSRICVTDHYWDTAVAGASSWYQPQDFAHVSQSLPLPQADGVQFLFGCETDMDKHFTLGMPLSRADDFDFIIIPTTHLHMKNMIDLVGDESPKEQIAKRSALWGRRLDAVLDMPLPFHKVGIAHLACSLLCNISRDAYLETLSRIPEDEMARLFAKAAERGCGIELNQSDMSFADHEADTVLRMFHIAKACGCKFYLGSDAHHPKAFSKTRDIFTRAIDLLDLNENDKFML